MSDRPVLEDAAADPAGARIPASEPAARGHWEVIAALGLMLFVLAVLDVAAIRSPLLIFSCAPLAFLMYAGVRGFDRRLCLGWSAACVLAAVVLGDARYAGLSYPAVTLGALAELHRRLRGRP